MIRPATVKDAGWICTIWNEVIETSTATFTTCAKTVEEIASLISERPKAFLVVTEVGFATYGRFREGPGYADAREATVYLANNACGHGTGKALLAELEVNARKAGIRTFVAGASGTNGGAIRFFEREGYFRVGQLPGIGQKFGQRLDLVLMQKNLQDCASKD